MLRLRCLKCMSENLTFLCEFYKYNLHWAQFGSMCFKHAIWEVPGQCCATGITTKK